MELNHLQLLIKLQKLSEDKITTMLKETTTEMRYTEPTPLTANNPNKDTPTYQHTTNKALFTVTAKCVNKVVLEYPPATPATI